jgi:hypothetical protein
MAKIDSIEARLLNWARWKMRAGGTLNYAGVRYDSVGSSSGYREAVIPVVDCEADETDAAIRQLPVHLRDTLAAHYTGAFVDVPSQARVLGCSVSTVHARINDAHQRLFQHFEAKRQAARAEAERLAALSGHPVVRRKEFYEL